MGFLTPLFLVGLVGLAVPVLIHLTRHERGKPIRFPSLMFLEKVPFQETSKRRIRHWLLFLMRLAALALLVAAFARPFVRGGRLATVGGPGAEEVVVLLDNSYSMEMGDGWERAVDRARSVVAALRPRDRASLVVFSETPQLVHRSITELPRILATLDTLRTTSLATRFAPAVKLAASTLAASQLPRRRVVVVSDFQRPAWSPDPDARLPEGTVVETAVIEADGTANVALTDLELGRQSAGGRDRVTVEARLVNTGEAAASAEVTLAVDETDLETVTVTVGAGGAEPVAFAPFTLTAPFTRGEVRLAGPAGAGLEQDNTLSFVSSPGGDLRVVVADPLGPGDSNLYLRGALDIAEGAGFETTVARGLPDDDGLAATDVVVLNGGPFPGGGEGDRLREFVEAGGGLLMALGERSGVPSVHQDFLPATVGPVSDADEGRRIGFVDYDHAIFEAFRGPRSGDFSQALFHRTRLLTETDGQVLARFDDGAPALVEAQRGRGRVLLWASGMDRFWNNLALQPIFLPFVHRVTRHLGGRSEVLPWHLAGTTVNLAGLAETASSWEIPDGAVAMEPGGGSVPLDPVRPLLDLDRRGIWEIRPPGQRPDHPLALAVNVDVAESDLTQMDVQAFAVSVGGAADASDGTPGGATADAAAAAVDIPEEDRERSQSFWRYLLAAAFLLMVSETALSNGLSRQRVKEKEVVAAAE